MKITLRQARKMSEISQRKMAEKLGVHEDTYRKIEKNPDLARIQQAKLISEYIGIPCDIIFFQKNSSLARCDHAS